MSVFDAVLLGLVVAALVKGWLNDGRIEKLEERIGSNLDDESVSEPTAPVPGPLEKIAELQLRVKRLEDRVPGHMTIGARRRW